MEIEFLESLVQNIGPIIVILNCYYLEATGSFECPQIRLANQPTERLA